MHSFGVLGTTLAKTLSPRLFSLIAAASGETITYGAFQIPPENLYGAVDAARTLGIGGLNVTMPYKQVIMQCLDQIAPEAAAIGSVNTVHITPEGATGHNTDYFGFLRMLRSQGVEIKGKRVLQCGMSGAGRAVYRALRDAGAAEIMVASTSPEKGVPYQKLATELSGQWDLIVNCTPVGMSPNVDESVVGEDILRRFEAAADIVYAPAQTKFLRLAKGLGLRTAEGVPMLAYQGIKSFSIWTGIELDDATCAGICGELAATFQ